jgi:hypothetical protein
VQEIVELTRQVGAECYRRERTCRHPSIVEPKVRKHKSKALDDEERPGKRIRVASTNSQDVITSSPQICDGIAPAVDNSSSFVRPQGSRLDVNSVAQYEIPPTPPTTPLQQTAFSLPGISEFDAGLSQLRTRRLHEQSEAQLHSPPLGLSQGSEWTLSLPSTANKEAYYLPFTGGSLGDGRAPGKPSLPEPQVKPKTATSDPSLGEMFAEAARAAGRQFYPPPQGEEIKPVEPSRGTPLTSAPKKELQNNWPPEPRVVSRDRHIPVAFTRAVPPTEPGEAQSFPSRRNEAGWWRDVGPSAPQSTTSIVPDSEISQPGTLQHECPESALSSFVKPIQCPEHKVHPPPDIDMINNFTLVNKVYSASPVSPVATAQHFGPTESSIITVTGSVLGQKQRKPPNPFSGRLHRAWLLQNPLPDCHTINTSRPFIEPSIEQSSGAQAAEASSSSLSRNKGKGNPVESLPGVLGVRRASPMSESFEESIRRSAKTAMELVNIHGYGRASRGASTDMGEFLHVTDYGPGRNQVHFLLFGG